MPKEHSFIHPNTHVQFNENIIDDDDKVTQYYITRISRLAQCLFQLSMYGQHISHQNEVVRCVCVQLYVKFNLNQSFSHNAFVHHLLKMHTYTFSM